MDEADEVTSAGPAKAKAKAARKSEVAPPPADADLWTFGEVAYHLRVSVASVRRLVDAGHLATTRVTVGDKRLIRREVVKAYLGRATEVTTPALDVATEPARPVAGASREPRGMVKASWVTGKDHFGLDADAKRGRPKKAAKS